MQLVRNISLHNRCLAQSNNLLQNLTGETLLGSGRKPSFQMNPRLYIFQLTCQIIVLQFVLWSVKGSSTYYLKPTGRHNVSETLLPSLVNQQIGTNTPVIGSVIPSRVVMEATMTLPSLKGPPTACPKPSTCPCPCPLPSSGVRPSALRHLHNTGGSLHGQKCPSLCICLCVGTV
ncbi:uncharacterized protein LOC114963022 [Acropora millepora]|uniref:uncharacterized protein LOC114963022 n=1 Tax=Acropora millepora TaxID=45264 RepID=UPI001CF4A8F8|nr:uncharacterized protein LOC114963022 [Acropora millepora]